MIFVGNNPFPNIEQRGIDMTDRDTNFEKLKEMLKDIDFCMLSTVDDKGDIHSRPMSLNGEIDEDGNLWFFTSSESLKAQEVERLPKVNASFSDPGDHRYVSISGSAQLVKDRTKIRQLWKPVFRAWFPEGPDQQDVALLKVHLEKAEYWDSPSSKIAQVVSFVSAIVTGKEAEFGENKKVYLGSD